MRNIIFSTALLFVFSGLKSQTVTIMDYNQLEERLNSTTDTLYLLNFWATWCKPCVEELPDFMKLNKEYKNSSFKMILVTLDFPKHLNSRVIPFLKKNEIDAEVILLDDTDANTWINKVNPDWDGSIPVTKFIQKNNIKFYNKTLNYNDLKTIIKEFRL